MDERTCREARWSHYDRLMGEKSTRREAVAHMNGAMLGFAVGGFAVLSYSAWPDNEPEPDWGEITMGDMCESGFLWACQLHPICTMQSLHCYPHPDGFDVDRWPPLAERSRSLAEGWND